METKLVLLGEMRLDKLLLSLNGGSSMNWDTLINFKIILLSIVIEALPFVLFSVIVSAVLQNFVTQDMIARIIPKNKLLSIVSAALLGVIFPVCDCGMVPVVRRLVSKGVPLHTAIAFMLAAPIINPVVALATGFAFRTNLNMVFFRMGTAFFVACFAGWLVSLFFKNNQLKAEFNHHHHHGDCGCYESHEDSNVILESSFSDKLFRTLRDASNEFFEMGKYLLIGAMLGGLGQVLLPRQLILSVGQGPFLSVGVMLLFAFGISVCSAADAFIAASFVNSFSQGSLIAFMVFGPMIDLKNTLMLWHGFHWRLVIVLMIIVSVLTALAAFTINLF